MFARIGLKEVTRGKWQKLSVIKEALIRMKIVTGSESYRKRVRENTLLNEIWVKWL